MHDVRLLVIEGVQDVDRDYRRPMLDLDGIAKQRVGQPSLADLANLVFDADARLDQLLGHRVHLGYPRVRG